MFTVIDIHFGAEFADPASEAMEAIRAEAPVLASGLHRWVEIEAGEEAAYDLA